MMRIFKHSVSILTRCALLATLAMAPVQAAQPVNPAEPLDLDTVRADLAKIDAYVSEGVYENASVIAGQDIKARDIYRGYLKKASAISRDLLNVKTRVERHDRTLTLQQLGALTQRLAAENRDFREAFRHGEDRFQTYQLVQKAIASLQDAITYWRLSNHYRMLYRGSVLEQAEDDEILKIKIQTAMTAIEELKAIMETREKLSQDLEEDAF